MNDTTTAAPASLSLAHAILDLAQAVRALAKGDTSLADIGAELAQHFAEAAIATLEDFRRAVAEDPELSASAGEACEARGLAS